MWFIFASTVYGALLALDPLLFTYIAYMLSANGVYLGVLSAIWSVAYVLCNKLSGSLADNGHNRVLVVLALTSAIPIPILLRSLNYITAILAYMLHALATAFLNLAISVTVLESIESSYWDRVNLVNRIINSFSRGLTLTIMAFLGINALNGALYATLFMMLIVPVVLPPIYMSFERRFYAFEKTLNRVGMYIKASASLLYLDQPRIASEVFAKAWNSYEYVSPVRVLIGVAGAVAIGDYVFSVIPLVLKERLQLTALWAAYGFAALIAIFPILVLSNVKAFGMRKAFAIFMTRLLLLILGFSFLLNTTSLMLYVIASSTLFMLLDIILYNTYVYMQAGFGTSNYFIARELGSIVGSILGGIAIGLGLHVFLLLAILLGLVTSLPLVI